MSKVAVFVLSFLALLIVKNIAVAQSVPDYGKTLDIDRKNVMEYKRALFEDYQRLRTDQAASNTTALMSDQNTINEHKALLLGAESKFREDVLIAGAAANPVLTEDINQVQAIKKRLNDDYGKIYEHKKSENTVEIQEDETNIAKNKAELEVVLAKLRRDRSIYFGYSLGGRGRKGDLASKQGAAEPSQPQ